MEAKIGTIPIESSDVLIGKETLSEILQDIENEAQEAMKMISIYNQRCDEIPDLEDVGGCLCKIMNLIERIR